MSFDPYLPDDPPESAAPAVSTACWMSMINGGKLLSQVTIPGVRLNGCAEKDLKGILRAGVRFLELECRNQNGCAVICLSNTRLPLKQLADCCCEFLQQNPSECLILYAREEEACAALHRILPGDLICDGGTLPHMEEARGKMLLPAGSVLTGQPGEPLCDFLKQAEQNPDTLFPYPMAADGQEQSLLKENRFGYKSLGVPVLDKPAPELIRAVIEVNFYARLEMEQ